MTMRLLSMLSVAVTVLAISMPAQAQNLVVRESDWVVRDFRFHTGEVLPELRLHYRTLGAPTGEPVLFLHGTGGSGANFLNDNYSGQLVAPGGPLDASRYFIIMPDAIGHGGSSKPSDGLRARFPRYNYDDMVAAQYRLVTEHLGVGHVRMVMGTSMGGMHAWLWGGKYPGFMDMIVPFASSPVAMSGRNWMLRRMLIDAIRADSGWRDGNYTTQPTAWRTAQVYFGIATGGGALALYTAAPTRAQADALVTARLSAAAANDTNDILYQFESAGDYDPTPGLSKITARVLAINSADDERNPPELGVMEQAMTRLKDGRYVLLPVTATSRGHGTTQNATLWKQHLTAALVDLPAVRP